MLVFTGVVHAIEKVYPKTILASNRAVSDGVGYETYPNNSTSKYIQDSNTDHKHSVTASGYLYGNTDSSGNASESRPVNFTIKVWKRRA